MRLVGALVGIMVAVGCIAPQHGTATEELEGTLTTFHSLPERLTGKTFAITARDKDIKETLEFQEYAKRLTEQLIAHGLSTNLADGVDYIVALTYHETVHPVQSSKATYGQTGTSIRTSTQYLPGPSGLQPHQTINTTPTYGVTGYRPSTVYFHRSFVRVEFYDAKDLSKVNQLLDKRLVLVSEDPIPRLKLFPAMIDAVATEFPGTHASEKEIHIRVP